MPVSERNEISLQEMRKYAGQHVVIMDGKVVASGKNLAKKIRKLIKEHPGEKFVITYIPKEDLLIFAS